MRIRAGTAADAGLLARFGGGAFRAAFAAANDPDDIEQYIRTAFSRQRLADELAEEGGRFLLAYDHGAGGGTLVGYAHLRIGATAVGVPAGRPVELARIYVDPERTGGGYGAALLAACVAEARRAGGEVLWLGVWERNESAQRFYARHGFRRVGEQAFLLGEDVQTDHVLALGLG